MGFEPMVRSRESLVFKTSSINHSDTSPQWLPPSTLDSIPNVLENVKPKAEFFYTFYFFGTAAPFYFCTVRRWLALRHKIQYTRGNIVTVNNRGHNYAFI